jgi:hypothetical protein
MSDESEISQVLDSIGRLKLGKAITAALAGMAIWSWGRKAVHPIERCVRWGFATVISLGFGYWTGFFS